MSKICPECQAVHADVTLRCGCGVDLGPVPAADVIARSSPARLLMRVIHRPRMKAAVYSALMGGLVPMALGTLFVVLVWSPPGRDTVSAGIMAGLSFMAGIALGFPVSAIAAAWVSRHMGWAAVALIASLLAAVLAATVGQWLGDFHGAFSTRLGQCLFAVVMLSLSAIVSLALGLVVGVVFDLERKPNASKR